MAIARFKTSCLNLHIQTTRSIAKGSTTETHHLRGRGMRLDHLVERASRLVSAATFSPEPTGQLVRGLRLFHQDQPSPFEAMVYDPVLCLILLGRKEVITGSQTISFGPGECLLVSHDLPVCSRITQAPYLALIFQVDLTTLRKVSHEVADLTPGESARAAEMYRADSGLLDALGRYLALVESPADAKILEPLVSKEIHYRLLVAPFGTMLRRLVVQDSNESAIARAIETIRDDLRSAIVIPELARRVGMSPSSFHKHFKAITKTTPLQYQKELRLVEARRRLRMGGASVTAVAFDVGYESPTQFSREYARKFGAPPSRDLAPTSQASV